MLGIPESPVVRTLLSLLGIRIHPLVVELRSCGVPPPPP